MYRTVTAKRGLELLQRRLFATSTSTSTSILLFIYAEKGTTRPARRRLSRLARLSCLAGCAQLAARLPRGLAAQATTPASAS